MIDRARPSEAADDSIVIMVAADPDLPPFERRREPVTLGIACPRGRAPAAATCSLSDSRGRDVPVQTSVLDCWSDGSIRWLLIDFQADVSPEQPHGRYDLRFDGPAQVCLPEHPVEVDASGPAVTVRTGAAAFHVARGGRSLFARVDAGDRPGLDTERSGIFAEDAGGLRYALDISSAAIERGGPLHLIVRVDGVLRAPGGAPLVDVVSRLHFFAGLGSVRVELSVTNPRCGRHRHGFWDLGDSGSIHLKDLVVVFALPEAAGAIGYSVERSEPMTAAGGRLEIYQDSSGGENWKSINHCNRHGQVTATFRGYRLGAGSEERHGLRAAPVVSVGARSTAFAISLPQFWQNCPKAVEAAEGLVTLGLFPRQAADPHELQGGERKTHTFFMCFGPDTVSETSLEWSRSPLRITASSSSYESAGVWGPLRAGSEEARAGYETLVNAAVRGPDAFVRKREAIDEYGWRHFGEIYADHEAVRQPGLVSHYNNQYDAIAGCATRFCQTADHRWWTIMDELAEHVADIDIYHCVGDRAAYNNGHFWHTCHYLPARTATHRSFSRQMGVPGGGPADEHNYTTGLMLHYFLTGSGRSREAVLQLAQWVLDMDDGAKSRFWWIERGDTGLASSTFSTDYHGPGRGGGNSVNALLDAHRLTAEPRYLRKAEQLVSRCIHPSDDPDALNLLDAESRWSYTVFLQVLGKYLEYRAEKGLIDGAYHYARAALLRYAAWMADREEPYLNHPERLEFPTETWPAQDLRKAAVFEFAARHEPAASARERFNRKADDFVNYAISTLQAMPTRSLTRPVVLLLTYGFLRPLARETAPALPLEPTRFDRAKPFVPYKRRVLAKMALLAAILGAAGFIAAWRLMWGP